MNGKKMIVKIIFNWFCNNDGETSGEDFYSYEIGELYKGKEVVEIKESLAPAGTQGLDKWSIKFDDGSSVDIFNPNQVFKTKGSANEIM